MGSAWVALVLATIIGNCLFCHGSLRPRGQPTLRSAESDVVLLESDAPLGGVLEPGEPQDPDRDALQPNLPYLGAAENNLLLGLLPPRDKHNSHDKGPMPRRRRRALEYTDIQDGEVNLNAADALAIAELLRGTAWDLHGRVAVPADQQQSLLSESESDMFSITPRLGRKHGGRSVNYFQFSPRLGRRVVPAAADKSSASSAKVAPPAGRAGST